MEEPSHAEICKAIFHVRNKIFYAAEEGLNTLLFVYYAGHGIQANMTEIMTNGGEKFRYPLENNLRISSKMKGAFVFSLFDCCREKVTPELMKKFRGLSKAAGDDEMDSFGVESINDDLEGPTRGAN